MRAAIALSGAAMLGLTAAWLILRKQPEPVIEQGEGSRSPSANPYLNFNFGKILSGDSNMKNTSAPLGKPVPQGIRLNNPLNIRENESVNFAWQGEHEQELSDSFEEFETPFYGIRAAARNLKTYRTKYQLDTVEGIIQKWAPPHENPTQKYIEFVANKAGVHAQSPLSAADYPHVIAAMIHFENGYNPYEPELIEQATAAGLA